MLYRDLPVSGVVSGLLSFDGDTKNFNLNGDLIIKDSTVYGQQFEKVIVKTTIGPEKIKFNSITAQKGHSAIDAKGDLFFDKKFIYCNRCKLI